MKPDVSPVPRAIRAADWTLRIAILIFALGLTRQYFTRVGSAFGSVALLEWDVPHPTIMLAENTAAVVILACAASLLWRPTLAALLVISGLVLAESCATVRAGGTHFSDYAPYAHSLRYLAPVALAILVTAPGRRLQLTVRSRTSAWILRLGLAVVFITHGWEAWKLHPHFIDFIISSGRRLGGFAITESAASTALKVIGIVDLLAALLVIVRPSPVVLGWLAFWGLITALSRPLSLGFYSYPEVLVRASHYLAPLAVACLVAYLANEASRLKPRPPPTRPA